MAHPAWALTNYSTCCNTTFIIQKREKIHRKKKRSLAFTLYSSNAWISNGEVWYDFSASSMLLVSMNFFANLYKIICSRIHSGHFYTTITIYLFLFSPSFTLNLFFGRLYASWCLMLVRQWKQISYKFMNVIITYTNKWRGEWCTLYMRKRNERTHESKGKKTLKFHRSQDLLFQSNFLLVELFYPLKMH